MVRNFHFSTKIVLLCVCWYAISSSSSILNKMILQNYPFPSTLALSNLMLVPLLAQPVLKFWAIKSVHLTKGQYRKYLFPISFGKAIAIVSSYFTLWKVSVSYAHTVKASMPLFAVVFSHFILKERQSSRIYVSLLPIVGGVIIASATEITFSATALWTALFSTGLYSLNNILAKKLMKESDIHPIRLLTMNSQLAAVLFFPFWLFKDAYTMISAINSDDPEMNGPDMWMLFLMLNAGVLSFLQNLCAFSLIHKLTALSYSVCGATKRIIIIVASLMIFHNPVTGANLFGMMLAIFGVFCYNRAKQMDRHVPESGGGLPFTRSHNFGSDGSLGELNNIETNDVMFRAVKGSTVTGSRLGDLDYSRDIVQHKLDDISNRRNFRHA